MAQHPADPQSLLDELERDRAILSERARMPQWFALAVGLALASWVGSPAVDPDRGPASYLFVVAAVAFLLGASTRSTGVRHVGWGVRGWAIGAALLIGALGLYSASLALVSLDLAWWVIVPSLAMLTAGWRGVHAVDEAAREELREGR